MKNRQTIRLKGYNYASTGVYFVTICTQNREDIFGNIENGEMNLNKIGEIVNTQWLSIPERFPYTTLDEFIIMPNHIHGIIIIAPIQRINVGATLAVARNEIPENQQEINNVKQGTSIIKQEIPIVKRAIPVVKRAIPVVKRAIPVVKRAIPVVKRATARVAPTDQFTIGQIIGAFKSLCVTNCLNWIKNNHPNMSLNKLWQRNYYEHIIRGENELNNIRQYIKDNPNKWQYNNHYAKKLF